MHYSRKKVLQFPCKKCIIILVRNKYTTLRYIVKENKNENNLFRLYGNNDSGWLYNKESFFDIQGNEPYKVSKHSDHYTWDEVNLLYMSDEVDDEAYMAIPNNGVTWVTLKEGKRARALVVLD